MDRQNDSWTTQAAVQAIIDLQDGLRGSAGAGRLTPAATDRDGRTLRDWLVALRTDIDHFLDRNEAGEHR